MSPLVGGFLLGVTTCLVVPALALAVVVSSPATIEAALAGILRLRRIEAAAARWARLSADPRTPTVVLRAAERALRDEVGR